MDKDNIPTGQDLDDAIENLVCPNSPSNYSTNTQAAFTAVDIFKPIGFFYSTRKDGKLGHFVRIDIPTGKHSSKIKMYEAEGSTRPEAICRALYLAAKAQEAQE